MVKVVVEVVDEVVVVVLVVVVDILIVVVVVLVVVIVIVKLWFDMMKFIVQLTIIIMMYLNYQVSLVTLIM